MTAALILAVAPAPATAQRQVTAEEALTNYRKMFKSTGEIDCPREEGEIVVCGRRQDEDAGVKYRREFAEQQPLAAEIGIGGGAKARAFVDQVGMPDGQISKRIMVGIKVPF